MIYEDLIGRYSWGSKMTGLELNDLGSILGKGRVLFTSPQRPHRPCGPHNHLSNRILSSHE